MLVPGRIAFERALFAEETGNEFVVNSRCHCWLQREREKNVKASHKYLWRVVAVVVVVVVDRIG